MDDLLLDDNPNYTRFIQSKLDTFGKIKLNLESNDQFLIKLIEDHKRNVNDKVYENLHNEHDLINFYNEMFGMQMYFVELGIYELSKFLISFTKSSVAMEKCLSSVAPSIQIETAIVPKTDKEKSRAEYIQSYFKANFTDKDTLTNTDIRNIFGITRPTIQSWREETKVLKMQTGSTPRNILYSKQEVIDACLSGKIRHLPGVKRKSNL